jgi:hypothetical protein
MIWHAAYHYLFDNAEQEIQVKKLVELSNSYEFPYLTQEK